MWFGQFRNKMAQELFWSDYSTNSCKKSASFLWKKTHYFAFLRIWCQISIFDFEGHNFKAYFDKKKIDELWDFSFFRDLMQSKNLNCLFDLIEHNYPIFKALPWSLKLRSRSPSRSLSEIDISIAITISIWKIIWFDRYLWPIFRPQKQFNSYRSL